MNYDESMEFASKTFKERNVPIRWMQYDSWFYQKGEGGGVKYWYPRDGEDYFPDGPHAVKGILAFSKPLADNIANTLSQLSKSMATFFKLIIAGGLLIMSTPSKMEGITTL